MDVKKTPLDEFFGDLKNFLDQYEVGMLHKYPEKEDTLKINAIIFLFGGVPGRTHQLFTHLGSNICSSSKRPICTVRVCRMQPPLRHAYDMNKVVGFKTCFKTLDRRVVKEVGCDKIVPCKIGLKTP